MLIFAAGWRKNNSSRSRTSSTVILMLEAQMATGIPHLSHRNAAKSVDFPASLDIIWAD